MAYFGIWHFEWPIPNEMRSSSYIVLGTVRFTFLLVNPEFYWYSRFTITERNSLMVPGGHFWFGSHVVFFNPLFTWIWSHMADPTCIQMYILQILTTSQITIIIAAILNLTAMLDFRIPCLLEYKKICQILH